MIQSKPVAFLQETRAIIWDSESASEIFSLGFYGKPIGMPKPKSADFDKPLMLDLMEATYLAEKGHITVYDPEVRSTLTLKEIKRCFPGGS